MNCRQTLELISAYSDQELTGQQMLEVGEHLRFCDDCAREWRETNEVRFLLRQAHFHSPHPGAEQRLLARIALPEEPAWSVLWSSLIAAGPLSTQRPRGRRLTAALALSSLAVLFAAVPFAPQARDSATGNAESTATLPVNGASVLPLPGSGWGLGFQPFIRGANAPAASVAVPEMTNTQQPMSSADTGPLRDVTMTDYEQSNAAWDDYQAGSAGSR